MANVSKGAVIVTSRSRSMLLSGKTNDSDRGSDSDQWFKIFSRWSANVCCFDFSGLDLFSHEERLGELILSADLQGLESHLRSVILDRLLACKNSA